MRRRSLLLVEDNVDLRTLFRIALASAGYDVREAEDGLAALKAVDADPPDAIVLDLQMPGVSGTDVLKELAQHAHTRAIRVIVVTGRNDDVPDADCVLRKPVTAERLLQEVARCLPGASPV